MRQVYRRLGAQALGAALLVSVLPSAIAVVLAPGAATPLPTGTPELAGTLVNEVFRPWVIDTPGPGEISGSVQDRVVRTASGTLDFYTRIFVSSVPTTPGGTTPPPFSGIELASRSIYSSFMTDVDWVNDKPGHTAPTEANRTADGSAVSFVFGTQRVTPADQPDGSILFYIRTNATDYNAEGWLNLGTNQGTSPSFTHFINVFQPVAAIPEPGTWAMLLAGIMGVVGVARRRLS